MVEAFPLIFLALMAFCGGFLAGHKAGVKSVRHIPPHQVDWSDE